MKGQYSDSKMIIRQVSHTVGSLHKRYTHSKEILIRNNNQEPKQEASDHTEDFRNVIKFDFKQLDLISNLLEKKNYLN